MILWLAMIVTPVAGDCVTPEDMCALEAQISTAEVALENAMQAARKEALNEREVSDERARKGATSTLAVDELATLETAQSLWRVSMEADCLLEASMYKSAFMSTIPQIELLKCQAQRLGERLEFLRKRYTSLGESE